MNNNNSLPDSAMIPHEDDIEVDDSFFDDDIDVVRAEYASDSDELAISFNNFQLYVNMACIPNSFWNSIFIRFICGIAGLTAGGI